jgi:hypothetical protein
MAIKKTNDPERAATSIFAIRLFNFLILNVPFLSFLWRGYFVGITTLYNITSIHLLVESKILITIYNEVKIKGRYLAIWGQIESKGKSE